MACSTVLRRAGPEEERGNAEKRPELPWKRAPAEGFPATRSRLKFAPRDYWCSPGLRHRTPTWPSSSGSRPRCILLTNLSWRCPEVAVSACRWPGPPGAVGAVGPVGPVSSCLRPPGSAAAITNQPLRTPEPLPQATAPSSSKIRTFPFKRLNTLYKQVFLFCF